MNKNKLLESAVLKRKEIDVKGEKVVVREPSALEHLRYSSLMRGAAKEEGQEVTALDRHKALAYLFHCCVMDDKDDPIFTEEEALTVLQGSSAVAIPMVSALTEFLPSSEDIAVKNFVAPSESSSSN